MGFASCRGDGAEGRGEGPEGGLFYRCMEGIRKEAERCCWLNSLVVTHSLAGGTGSGFGSGLLQARKHYTPAVERGDLSVLQRRNKKKGASLSAELLSRSGLFCRCTSAAATSEILPSRKEDDEPFY